MLTNYYSAVIYIAVIVSLFMGIHLSQCNELLTYEVKRKLILISVLIIVGTICEFLGVLLNGKDLEFILYHRIVKAIEFSIAPLLPVLFAEIIGLKGKKREFIYVALAINVILEIISIRFGFIFCIDDKNIYNREKFYFIYVIMYTMGILLFILQIASFCKEYQNKNDKTLIAMLIFLVFGLGIQIVNSNLRTNWLTVSIVYMMFYIYYSDLMFQIDSLTKLLNRVCYESLLKNLNYSTAIIMLDANDFKFVNDNYGHHAGDVVLKKLANVIKKSYSNVGYCFRIGGDEFCVILKKGQLEKMSNEAPNYDTSKMIDKLNQEFISTLAEERKLEPLLTDIAIGYRIFQYNVDELTQVLHEADKDMYEKKKEMKL